MFKKRTNIYLRTDQVKRLRAISKKTGSSSAELVRRAVDAFLEKEAGRQDGDLFALREREEFKRLTQP